MEASTSDIKLAVAEPKPKPSRAILAAVVFLAVFLVMAVVFIILFATKVIPLTKIPPPPPKICSSPTCTKLSGKILSSMDLSADPCTNWFQYACGGYQEEAFIASGKQTTSPFHQAHWKLLAFFKDQLSDSPSSINNKDPSAFQSMKELYQGCLNATRRNELGIKPLTKFITKFGGLWVADAWNAATFDLTTLLSTLNSYDAQPFVLVSILPNPLDTAKHELVVLPPLTNWMPKMDEEFRNQTADFIKKALGKDPDAKKLDEAVNFAMNFSKVAAQFAVNNATSAFQNKMTLEELAKICCHGVDWARYFSTVLGENVDQAYEVYVADLEILQELNQLIKTASSGIINDIAIASFIFPNMKYLTVDVGKTKSAEDRAMSVCLGVAKTYMRPAYDALFMKKYYKGSKKTKKDVTELTTNIIEAFFDLVSELNWFDRATKDKIELKSKRTARVISHPEMLMNMTFVEQVTPKGISRDDYFDGVMKVKMSRQKLWMSIVGKDWIEIITPPWGTAVATVNAYYMLSNVFHITAGIISEPFYTEGAPMYMNYGALGVIVGHESTHGYDNRGRQYAPDGLVRVWWPKTAIEEYERRAECFINQFNELTFHLKKENRTFELNGNRTLGENIADAGGLRVAFKAYENWQKMHGREPMLVGMPKSMTWQKLFFLSTVRPFCSLVTGKDMERFLRGVHTPPIARVRTFVLNSDDFSTAFDCPIGSPMNPKKKCRIW